MKKSDIQEQALMRSNVMKLLKSSEQPENGTLALQMLKGMPYLQNETIAKAVSQFKFRHQLYEIDEVWYGEHAGKKLASLDTATLRYVLNISKHFLNATKGAKGDKNKTILGIHANSIEKRKNHIMSFDTPEKHICIRKDSYFKNRLFYYVVDVFEIVKEPQIEDYSSFSSDTIVKALNNTLQTVLGTDENGGLTFIISVNQIVKAKPLKSFFAVPQGDFIFLLDAQKVYAEVAKRPEIVQAKKGHYYNLNNYKKNE